jgi:DNA-binding IclR family transcriptional regulator
MPARSPGTLAQGIQSVETGGALLQALVTFGSPMMLKDLAGAAGMPPAKAHRYLVSFIRLGLAQQDPVSGRYALGGFALQMGLAALGRLDAVRIASGILPELAPRLGTTVAVAVWGNKGATIVRWEDSRDIVTVNVRAGGVMPLLTSATGRCFAAWLPPGATALMIQAELDANSPGRRAAPRSLAAVSRLLAPVRRAGLARAEGSLIPGINALSAPVFDHRGAMILALTALGYAGTFDCSDDGPVARDLRAVAKTLSHQLGAPAAEGGLR